MSNNEGTTHKIFVMEGTGTEDEAGAAIIEPRFNYECLAQIFKNGHLYEIGDTIELSESTARNFLKINEIKEINK